jgi:hypothetical protein
MSSSRTFFHRLAQARLWIALQFLLTPVLIAAGLAWTRLPDKNLWQVALSLLIPLVLAISFLELQAGTIRKVSDDDGRRVKLGPAAATFVLWIAFGWLAWAALDWCDDHIYLWAGYLTSEASAHSRATVFTYSNLVRWFTWAEWLLRWIALPAKLIPAAVASAQWGLRLPVRRIFRCICNWKWWLGVVVAAVIAVWLPSHFFDKPPAGSVSAQEWHVVFKLIGAYLLAVASWVFLLVLQATLAASPRHEEEPPSEFELVGAPVLSGTPSRTRGAAAEIPEPE